MIDPDLLARLGRAQAMMDRIDDDTASDADWWWLGALLDQYLDGERSHIEQAT